MSWSKENILKLREYYIIMSNAQLIQEFAPKTLIQIQNKACKLGVAKRRKFHNWRKICNEYKPTIILTQVIPREK